MANNNLLNINKVENHLILESLVFKFKYMELNLGLNFSSSSLLALSYKNAKERKGHAKIKITVRIASKVDILSVVDSKLMLFRLIKAEILIVR
jgi:hypothetical protein